MRAFSHQDYLRLLEIFQSCGRKLGGVKTCLIAGHEDAAHRVVLRHDVDRRPGQSVRMANLEASFGIQSTYYFRCSPDGNFPQTAIRAISDLGHEVGYHYETLAQAKGNLRLARDYFCKNLAHFRKIAPCETVSMHGSPLSPHHNLEPLQEIDLRELGILGDAVMSFKQYRVHYFTDAAGEWNTIKNNFRDHLPSHGDPIPDGLIPADTPTFIKYLKENSHCFYLSTHPERWAHASYYFMISLGFDMGASLVKRSLIPLSRLVWIR